MVQQGPGGRGWAKRKTWADVRVIGWEDPAAQLRWHQTGLRSTPYLPRPST